MSESDDAFRELLTDLRAQVVLLLQRIDDTIKAVEKDDDSSRGG